MSAQVAELSVFTRLNVLGDGTRARLLSLLEAHELTVGEICQVTLLPQSTVSRHLRILAEDGWVVSRADGTSRYYRTAPGIDQTASDLWSVVRERMDDSGALTEDRERVRSVLAARQASSTSFFAESAVEWERLRAEFFGRGSEFAVLFGLLDSDGTVGDLGCGTGELAVAMAPFAGHVIGVDRVPEMLEVAEARASALDAGENLEFRAGEMEALPIEDGELGLAMVSLVLHYVAEPDRVLREVARTLSPGGRLVTVNLRDHDREELREELSHVWLGFSPERIQGWLEQAGFEGVRSCPITPEPSAKGPLLFLTSAVRRAER